MEIMWLFVGSMIAVVYVCNVLHWREISKHFDDNEEE